MPATFPTSDASAPPDGADTLASSLYRRLRDDIVEGSLKPGEKLRLDELRQRHGVSLSPLREALSRLVSDGFVISKNQRGFTVAPVSVANFEDVIRLRVMLETLALRESVEKGDEDWELRLVTAMHRLTRHEARRDNQDAWREWELRHREYHQALIGACASPMLLQFCSTLMDLNDRYRRIFLARAPLDRDIGDEHRRIGDAALARDGEKAAEFLKEHILRTAKNVSAALARQSA